MWMLEPAKRAAAAMMNDSCLELAHASRARSSYLVVTWGSASLHPRAGSPAEHLGWGARLYAFTRYAGYSFIPQPHLIPNI